MHMKTSRKLPLILGLTISLSANGASAQTDFDFDDFETLLKASQALHYGGGVGPKDYNPRFELPTKAAKSINASAGIINRNLSEIGNITDLFVSGNYAFQDGIEFGASIILGALQEARDGLSAVVVGGKYGLQENSALSGTLLLPVGDADDLGLALGYMTSMEVANYPTNAYAKVSLLDGFAPVGIGIDALVEPSKEFNEKITGFLDILLSLNTDDIGNTLGLNLRPHADYKLGDAGILNVGLSLGIAGDAKQEDLGLEVIYKRPIR